MQPWLGRSVGNLDCAVVSKAIARFGQRMRTDPRIREQLAVVQLQVDQMTNDRNQEEKEEHKKQ
jgi:hypothetical protein